MADPMAAIRRLTQLRAMATQKRPTVRTEVRRSTHEEEILARYDEVDRKLVAKGFPPTSPWWRATIERYYRSGKRQAVMRVGRRGGKSSSLSRLMVVEALYGHHDVPPGDIGVGAIISTKLSEANQRLATVQAILDALDVPYRPWGAGVMGVKIVGRRIGFSVYAASVAGVSGFTAIFVLCDEVSKWKDKDTGVNPAGQVLASVRPTMATMPNARIVLSSSPFGMLDAHYDAFEEGETKFQITAFAQTWTANPTLTEEDTHAIEPDEAVWLREYAAIPQAEAETTLLTELLIDRAMRAEPGDLPWTEGWSYVAAMDPATRTNAWTLVVAGQDLSQKRHVVLAREWVPRPGLPLDPLTVFVEITHHLAMYGLDLVYTDQHATEILRAVLRALEQIQDAERAKDPKKTFPPIPSLIESPWTVTTKREGYEHLLKLAQSNRLGLPRDQQMKLDLLGIRKVITRSGVQYQLAEVRGRHSDYAPAVALAVADARWIAVEVKRPDPADVAREARAKRFRDEAERPHWQARGGQAGHHWKRSA